MDNPNLTEPVIIDALRKVVTGEDLTRVEARTVMEAVMSGIGSEAQIAALLTALSMKGETTEELTGFAEMMRAKVRPVPVESARTGRVIVDTCGTGGDGRSTFNVSTASAFVVAGAGLFVAKHGNRSVSSRCGSADVLEALGIDIEIPPERVGACIEEVGIGFCYAPLLHPAMRHVMPTRKAIRIRTVFNLLGPLTNPARARAQVIGVYDEALVEPLARVLADLGSLRAFVVHGEDGLDEISTTAPTHIAEVTDGAVRTYTVNPEDFGLVRRTLTELGGGDAATNAKIIRAILKGERGPRRDIVLVNAGAAIVAGGLAETIGEGVAKAAAAIDSGAALEKLERLIAFCERPQVS